MCSHRPLSPLSILSPHRWTGGARGHLSAEDSSASRLHSVEFQACAGSMPLSPGGGGGLRLASSQPGERAQQQVAAPSKPSESQPMSVRLSVCLSVCQISFVWRSVLCSPRSATAIPSFATPHSFCLPPPPLPLQPLLLINVWNLRHLKRRTARPHIQHAHARYVHTDIRTYDLLGTGTPYSIYTRRIRLRRRLRLRLGAAFASWPPLSRRLSASPASDCLSSPASPLRHQSSTSIDCSSSTRRL